MHAPQRSWHVKKCKHMLKIMAIIYYIHTLYIQREKQEANHDV